MAGLTSGEGPVGGGTVNDFHLQFHHHPDRKAIVRKQRRDARRQKRLHRKRSAWFDRQEGMVSAEFAVVMFAVSLVMIMVVFAATVGVSYVQTQDAARQAARMIARGESQSVATRAARESLPGAKVSVSSTESVVSVHVSASVSLPVAKLSLGTLTVESSAHSPRENDAP